MSNGRIIRISGPTVQASGMRGSFMHEVLRLGKNRIKGEVIRMEDDALTVQVYESTIGLRVGDIVERSGELLSVELGPGLLGSILDGIQRPLPTLSEKWGNFIQHGAEVPALDRTRKWAFKPVVSIGAAVRHGMVIGTVQETQRILHKIMVPQGVEGCIESISAGDFAVDETVTVLDNGAKLTLMQKSGIREPRPVARKLPFNVPLITGQRILDTLFPVAEGGSAVIPGGFGTGKTVLEQTIAKYANADIVVYIGCGERGNEMADVLQEFPQLTDPYTGRSLMERTILIANTSNMPVAAREASIYTGITLAEYYRDMGYRVAVMADSTSRWAEALREISSRLEEMPGEEGYPTYLASRLGIFYERSGRVQCLGRPDETGSITLIGAVSPPGGDFSEPVTQASMRMASSFWALDYDLAHQRHFPAINWLNSFSLSYPTLVKWLRENVDERWPEMLAEVNAILQREEELAEVVKIVGLDAMGDRERIELEAAAIMREGYLRQSSFHETDAFCTFGKQREMLSLQLNYVARIKEASAAGFGLDAILSSPVRERVMRLNEIPENAVKGEVKDIIRKMDVYFSKKAEE